MTQLKAILVTLALFLLPGLILFNGCNGQPQEPILVQGSTTIELLVRKAFAAFDPNFPVTVSASGSANGLTALIEGKCHIAASSRQISKQELDLAHKKGIKLKQFLIAYDMIVPIVHPQNPIDTIRLEQLRRVFSGEIEKWNQLAGNDTEIRLAVRDGFSGTCEVWKQIVSRPPEDLKRVLVQPSSTGVLAYVAKHPNAIGYVSHAFVNPEVKPLRIGGLNYEASEKDAIIENYPIRRDLYLYMDEKLFKSYSKIKRFIIFLTMIGKGEGVIREAGFFPVNRLR